VLPFAACSRASAAANSSAVLLSFLPCSVVRKDASFALSPGAANQVGYDNRQFRPLTNLRTQSAVIAKIHRNLCYFRLHLCTISAGKFGLQITLAQWTSVSGVCAGMTAETAATVGLLRAPYRKRKHQPRAHSRHIALGDIDGRLRAARLMRQVIRELTEHCGGRPSAVQRKIIQRAAVLHLRLALLDAETGPDGQMSEKTAREYLCWNNAYVRTLNSLGLKAVAPTATLTDYLAAKGAAPQPSHESA
jgi:hypothetical protein